MLYDVAKPVSPMLQFIEVQDGVAIYHKINYLEDCDRFVVEEVLKFNVDDWQPVRKAAPKRSTMHSDPINDATTEPTEEERPIDDWSQQSWAIDEWGVNP